MKRILAMVLVAPLAALAQGKVEEKKAEQLREIERGFFLGVNGGLWATIAPPAGAGSKAPFLSGQALQVEMGFDIGERVSPAIFFVGAATSRAGSDYTGLSTMGAASGDFSLMIPGATAKIRLVGFADSQEVQRLWVYARVSAGFVLYSPAVLIPKNDVLISAGPGLEYFTRLRHLSIGVEANFHFMALTSSLGFSVLPSVRYAF